MNARILASALVAALAVPALAQEPAEDALPSVSQQARRIKKALAQDRSQQAVDLLKQCELAEEAFSYNLKRVVDPGSGFVFFLSKQGGNAFQMCVNRNQSIFFQGIPVWGRAGLDGPNLIVESVQPGGTSMIPAEEIATGQVAGAELKVSGRPSHPLAARNVYYIERARVTGEAISAGGANTVYADALAWVSFVIDPRTKEPRVMQVRIKDTDPAKAEADIRKSFTLGAAAKSAWADKASLEKIIEHVKRELPKHDASKPLVKSPMVEINLFAKKESSVPEPVVVVSIRAAARQSGVDSRGEPILIAEPYDELLFCYSNHQLEPRSEHVRHLSRR